MDQVNSIDKMNLLNLFIEKFPEMSKQIITSVDIECSKNREYMILTSNKKLDHIINYINEKNLIDDSIKSLLEIYKIIEFDFQSFYKDFFDNLEYLNSESFFSENSIKRKSSNSIQIEDIKSKIVIFNEDYGNIYAHIIKQVYNVKKSLNNIKTIKNSEANLIRTKADKYLNSLENLKQELSKNFLRQIYNYQILEQALKDLKIKELIEVNNEHKQLLEKEFFDIQESIESLFDEAKSDEEKIESNYEFLEALPDRISYINKLNSFKQNVSYHDKESSVASDINLMSYKMYILLKDKIELIIPKTKILSDTGLEKIFDKEYLPRAIEIKKLAGEYSES